MTTQGRDFLVAAPERWDEACFLAPTVRALQGAGLGVGILCPAAQRRFWETLAGLEVVDHPEKFRAKAVAATIAGQWQAAILWEPGIAAEACLHAKIPRRVGPAEKGLKKLLTHPAPLTAQTGPLEHRVRHYLLIPEALGLDVSRPEFFAPVSIGPAPEPRSLLLCPDSDFGRTHEWPLDRWCEVAQAALTTGVKVTVAGLSGGDRLGERLVSRLGGEIPYFTAHPLAETLPLLAAHSLLLAADGSLPHLAAHVGTTCVTLFGPNDPSWKRPLGRRHVVVRRHVPCAPCFLTKCPLDGRCQNDLDTARVMAPTADLLRQS